MCGSSEVNRRPPPSGDQIIGATPRSLQAIEGFVEQRRHVQRRELDLVRRQRHAPVQRLELVAGEVRHPHVAHLAVLLQAAEGLGHFVEVHQRVGAVDQQQVQAVGAELAQRFLGRGDDVFETRVVVLDGVRRALAGQELDAALADDLDALAQAGLGAQGFAEQGLDAVVAVDVGVVEGGHAEGDAFLDKGDARRHRHVPFAQAPHAGNDARQVESALAGGDTGAGVGGLDHGGFLALTVTSNYSRGRPD